MGTPDCVVLTVRRATADDLPAIVALYERVIAHMRVNPPDVWWDMDAHPTVERLERETAEGNLFVAAGEPLGVVAIIYAARVDNLWNSGQREEAVKAAKNAKLFTLISLGVGVLSYIIGFAFGLFSALMGY